MYTAEPEGQNNLNFKLSNQFFFKKNKTKQKT